MVFSEALEAIEKGIKLKRTDWGHPKHAYIQLDTFYGEPCFKMVGGGAMNWIAKHLQALTKTKSKSG